MHIFWCGLSITTSKAEMASFCPVEMVATKSLFFFFPPLVKTNLPIKINKWFLKIPLIQTCWAATRKATSASGKNKLPCLYASLLGLCWIFVSFDFHAERVIVAGGHFSSSEKDWWCKSVWLKIGLLADVSAASYPRPVPSFRFFSFHTTDPSQGCSKQGDIATVYLMWWPILRDQ